MTLGGVPKTGCCAAVAACPAWAIAQRGARPATLAATPIPWISFRREIPWFFSGLLTRGDIASLLRGLTRFVARDRAPSRDRAFRRIIHPFAVCVRALGGPLLKLQTLTRSGQ